MRIVYVNPAANLGGGELSLLDLISSTRNSAPLAELHLVVTADGPLAERARDLGAFVHINSLPRALGALGDSTLRGRSRLATAFLTARVAPEATLAALRYARCLQALIGDLAPDVIHSNGIKTHLLIRLCRFSGIPVVWHIRDMIGARPLVSTLLRKATAGVVGAIAVSEAVARDARLVIGNAFPIAAVHDGIDIDRFVPGPGNGPNLDTLAGLTPASEATIRVGLVATYARWKGHEVFLEAMARLASGGHAQVRGYIVGGPIYETRGSQFSEEELRARAELLGLTGRVGFIPFQVDPAEIYRSLDVVIHASTLPEPFGRTIVESMACRRATIVARAGGASELFQDGQDAVGVTPGDVDDLANAIGRLIDDPNLRASIAERARCSALERFDRRRLGGEVLAVYRRFGIRAEGPSGRDDDHLDLLR